MNSRVAVLLCVVGLAVAGCGKKEPSGQVVASIDGKEITAIDLRNELGDFKAPDAKTRLLAERQALENIISRRVLVEAAKDQKIDKSPEYAQQKIRMDETLLVRMWQDKLAKAVPPASRDEINSFIAAHPDLYANHKVLLLDQVVFPRPADPRLIAQLQPIKTIPDLIQWLTTNNIPYRTGNDELDVLRVPPQYSEQVLRLPPNELFVVPARNTFAVNHVREVRLVPVPQDLMVRHATQYLNSTRTQEALQREFGSAIARRRGDIKYAKAYQPAAPPKAAAAKPAAPAAKN